MMQFSGKSVYKGIVLGKTAVLGNQDTPVKHRKIDDVKAEVERVRLAGIKAKEQLQILYDKALKEVGETNAAIFEVHQMMLEDEDFLDSIHNMIQTEMVNAEYAIAMTGDNFSEMFAAMDDDYIRKNPFKFQLATVVVNDSVTREAITRKQERSFLEFIKADSHFSRYYDGIYILFHTGLRISEFVRLTISDLVFENRKINVNHQLQRDRNMNYIIEDTKTSSGTRLVPMMDDVYDCFRRILATRAKPKVEPMIDGYTGFLFLDKNGMPMVALHWEKYFQHIREKYNSIYKVQLPKITPHVCRHTFCSNMAKSGMNPKTLQYIMGHSDIGVTLNTYTHLGFDDVQEEMKRVCNQ